MHYNVNMCSWLLAWYSGLPIVNTCICGIILYFLGRGREVVPRERKDWIRQKTRQLIKVNLHCSGLAIPILEQQPYAPARNRHCTHQSQRANLSKTEKFFSPIGSAINGNDNLTTVKFWRLSIEVAQMLTNINDDSQNWNQTDNNKITVLWEYAPTLSLKTLTVPN